MPSETSSKVIRIMVLAAFLIFIMIAVSQAIGLGRSGFDSSEIQRIYIFYAGPGAGFLIGLVLLALVSVYMNRSGTYGDSVYFNNAGEYPAPKIAFIKSPFRLFILSVFLASFVGIYAVIKNQTFTGVGSLPQQFQLVDSLLFTSALIPAAENLGAAFVAAFFVFVLRYYAKKNNIGKSNFSVLAFVGTTLVFGLYGLFLHLLRYSSSDIALLTVFIFWALGGLLTVVSGSFIPFWVLHIANNVFFDLKEQLSNDYAVATAIGIILIMGILLLILGSKNGKKKS